MQPVRPGETVRFESGDCKTVFDLGVAPLAKWPQQFALGTEPDIFEPTCCPFCGSEELKPLHDRASHSG